MDHLWQDLRFSLRSLRRTPGVAAAAIVSLALGIGANSTIFTLINAVFLNPLPVERPSRLAAVFTTDENLKSQFGGLIQISYPNYEDVRDRIQSFEGVAAYTFPQAINLTTGGDPEQVFGELVTANYFDVLGVKPAVGRFFLPEEDAAPGAAPVVVLSHGLWERRFGSDPGIVGRTVTLNGHAFTVVGVAARGYKGVSALFGPELWAPTMMYREILPQQFERWFRDRRALLFNAAGRLRAGATLEQAKAELGTLGKALEAAYPEPNDGRSLTAMPLTEATIFPGLRQALVLGGTVLMIVVGLVLLIACSNVANLLLAKATTRRKEIAVRLSLGSPRRRLVTQLVTESVVLALAGGALGMVVAFFGRNFISSMRPTFVPANLFHFPLDGRVLAFTFAVAAVTGIVFGLVPALQGTRPDVVEALKEESRTSAPGGRRVTLRGALVAAQVALSFVALVAAGLFLRSLAGAHDIDPGFETQHLAVVIANVGQAGYDQPRGEAFYRDVVERVGALPEVERASLASNLPLFGGFGRTVFLEGEASDDAKEGKLTQSNTIDVGYFETVGIPILEGRAFRESDREGSVLVAVVNQEMAEKYWPGEPVIGKRFRLYGNDDFHEVVGVAKTVKYVTLGEKPQPFFYMALRQTYSDAMAVYVRSRGGAGAALKATEREIREMDPQVPRSFALTVQQVIDQSLWPSRVGAALLAALGGLGLLLAAVGLYGVLAYSVSQRRREIGVRMAIGAGQGSVLKMVVLHAMKMVGFGVALGLLVAFGVSRLVATLLYGISPTDPLTFVAVPLLLATVALVAASLPALRASRVDPLTALRIE